MVFYKIKQLGYIILKKKVTNFDKSQCSWLVAVGNLYGRWWVELV